MKISILPVMNSVPTPALMLDKKKKVFFFLFFFIRSQFQIWNKNPVVVKCYKFLPLVQYSVSLLNAVSGKEKKGETVVLLLTL